MFRSRYAPSQSDVGVFTALKSAPSAAEYPHAARWYEHIASWEKEHATLPGDKDAASKLFGGAGTSAPAAPAAAAADDDDEEIDLFASDDVRYIFTFLHRLTFRRILTQPWIDNSTTVK